MSKALVVGGTSGIGLSIALLLLDKSYERIYIVGKDLVDMKDVPIRYQQKFKEKVESYCLNLINEEYDVFDEISDINTLIVTAGFGRVAFFDELHEKEIDNLIRCNELSIIRIIKKYYKKIASNQSFYTMVMGSIAGHVASPLFSVYGAAKSGLCHFIENINIELTVKGVSNRILDVSPGSLKHTKFSGGENRVEELFDIAGNMLEKMFNREILFIPQYSEVFCEVIKRYQQNPIKYGIESYEYKTKKGRIAHKKQLTVGYLSGTFDLFHIGHLNLLKRAKGQCDYLIVGVHKDGSWKGKETFIPYEERVEILKSCKYVDEVIQSLPEDSDAYDVFKIDKLFVGSDYKGTERFRKYEEYFADKEVEIVYFPYTKGTSSTQLREQLSRNKDNFKE